MGKEFQKFKRKMCVGGVIRALLFGLSLGIIAVAIQWLSAKLSAAEADVARYALMAAIPALLGFGLMLALLLPTNKRLAKRLDKSLALGEKVQTMVEFRHDTGDMATLQRMDTERILSETPKRRIKGACTWLFAVLPILACLCMVGTILVPAEEPDAPPPVVDSTFSLTPWQEQALKNLIEEVRTSDMEADPKGAVVQQLESLLIQLKSIKKESTMKETVVKIISNIHDIVEEHNTYDVVATSLGGSLNETVKKLGSSIRSLKPLLIAEQMDAIGESLAGEGKAETAGLLGMSLGQALEVADVETSNEVVAALAAFADALTAITAETTDDEVQECLSDAEDALNLALGLQMANEEVEINTIYRLMTIFGLDVKDIPEEIFRRENDSTSSDVVDDNKPDDEEEKSDLGGLGPGFMEFAANEEFYDPISGTYVTYGEVIDTYYAKISGQIVDGKVPPELEEILSDYFAILYKPED